MDLPFKSFECASLKLFSLLCCVTRLTQLKKLCNCTFSFDLKKEKGSRKSIFVFLKAHLFFPSLSESCSSRMFLFICGFKEGVSQMLLQLRPCADARAGCYAGMYPLPRHAPYSCVEWVHVNAPGIDDPMLCVGVLSLVCADVGLPAVSEQQMGVKEVRAMVQLTLRILAEPYSKSPGTAQNPSVQLHADCQDSNLVDSALLWRPAVHWQVSSSFRVSNHQSYFLFLCRLEGKKKKKMSLHVTVWLFTVVWLNVRWARHVRVAINCPDNSWLWLQGPPP